MKSTATKTAANFKEIANRIKELIETKRLYLRPDLSISDIAHEIDEDIETVTDVFELLISEDYNLYLNELRIMHAGILFLFYDPTDAYDDACTDARKDARPCVSTRSGFTNHTHFHNTCIQLTGLTPESMYEYVRSRRSLKGVFLKTPIYLIEK